MKGWHYAVLLHIYATMYGCTLLCAEPLPVDAVVNDSELELPSKINEWSFELPPFSEESKVNPCVCDGNSAVLNVWVLAPPVSCTVSKSLSAAFKPTITLPAPKAAQVPNPNNVPGLVATAALI